MSPVRQLLLEYRSSISAAALAIALAGASSPALAVPLATGTDIAVSYDQAVTGQPDLTGTLNLQVTNLTSTQINLGVTIDNTTSPLFTSGRLTGIGWNSSILPTGATDTSSIYSVDLSQNFPANSAVNLCLSSGSTCAGGGSGGLLPGQSDIFNLTLTGNFGSSTVDFSSFAAKFQTAYGSFEPQGTITSGTCTSNCGGGGGGGNPVPEPGTLSLLGVGVLGSIGYLFRRSRAQTSQAIA